MKNPLFYFNELRTGDAVSIEFPNGKIIHGCMQEIVHEPKGARFRINGMRELLFLFSTELNVNIITKL